MYSKTITVFNKYTNQKDEIFWYPTVIKGVQLIVDKSANIEKTGLDTADTATLHVLYRIASDEKVVAGKKYLEPKKWAKQINDTLGHTVTFATLTEERKIEEITRITPSYLDKTYENNVQDWVISMSLKYRNVFIRTN